MYNRAALYSVLLIFCMVNGTVFAAAEKAKSEKDVFEKGQKISLTIPGEQPVSGMIVATFKESLKHSFGDNPNLNSVWKGNMAVAIYMLKIDPAGSFTKAPLVSALTEAEDLFFVHAGGSHVVHRSWMKSVPSESTK